MKLLMGILKHFQAITVILGGNQLDVEAVFLAVFTQHIFVGTTSDAGHWLAGKVGVAAQIGTLRDEYQSTCVEVTDRKGSLYGRIQIQAVVPMAASEDRPPSAVGRLLEFAYGCFVELHYANTLFSWAVA